MSKRRKLLTPRALNQLETLGDLGVPLATAMAKLELDMSRPSAKKLLDIHIDNDGEYSPSLFPDWLDAEGPHVQECPDNYTYIGFFPLGHWTCSDSSI
jgi:hypothetical protein